MSINNFPRQNGGYYANPAYPYYPANQMGYFAPAQQAQQSQQSQQGQQGFPGFSGQQPQAQQQQQQSDVPGMLPLQQSYIENILRLNKGKLVKVYMTFEMNSEWNAKVFTGIIEAAGRDHLILSESGTGRRVLLLMIYLDWVEFQEEINYEYPFDGTQLSTFEPR